MGPGLPPRMPPRMPPHTCLSLAPARAPPRPTTLTRACSFHLRRPAPTDVDAIGGTLLDGETKTSRPSSDDEPMSALAFKIMTDPFVGSLTFARMYSGVLNKVSPPYPSPEPNHHHHPTPNMSVTTPP